MPNKDLTFKNVLDIFEIINYVEDYSYHEEDLYKYNLIREYDFNNVSNKKYCEYKFFNHPTIFNVDGSLRTKYTYSHLKGFDIIDVINALKYGLAVLHMDYNNKTFTGILSDISDDILYKVTSNFIPDAIQDIIDTMLTGEYDYDCVFLQTIDFILDIKSEGLSETRFNTLSSEEKRVALLTRCYYSDKAYEWSYMHRNFIEEGGETLYEFKDSLSKIKTHSREEYIKKVQKQIGLTETGSL
jgi:hypothetical protein